MSFLSPIFVWALPLLTLPVVVHLMTRRRRRVVGWGAMQFLVTSARRRRRVSRLKDLLLLLLRILAILLLIGALARPLVQADWLHGGSARDVILILDNSMSTARREGAATTFEYQIKAAIEALNGLTDKDAVRMLLAGGRPTWLIEQPTLASASERKQIAARLGGLAPTRASADIVEALNACLSAPLAGPGMTRLIIVISDGQAHSWRPDARDAWLALKSRFDEARPRPVLNVVLADKPTNETRNLSVQELTSDRAVAAVGETLTLSARIRNNGAEAARSVLLNWREADRHIGVSSAPALEPGAETTVTLQHSFGDPAIHRMSCQLDVSDNLALDDDAEFIVDVVESIPVLVVDGTSDPDAARTDTGYLLAAMGARGSAPEDTEWKSVFQPTLIRPRQLEEANWSDYRCIILANVETPAPDLVDRLERYIAQGGGLWLALGDQTDPESFNASWHRAGEGLSPLKLLEPTGDEADRETFRVARPPEADHPATRMLADTKSLDMDRLRVFRSHTFAAAGREDVSMILRLEQGAPLALERTVGKGRLIIQSIPLGVRWSNFPVTHSYVAMVHEWLWFLTEPGMTRRNLNAGELISQPFAAIDKAGPATIIAPDKVETPVPGIRHRGENIYQFADTFLPGAYSLEAPMPNDELKTFAFHVRRDPAESDLTAMAGEDWRAKPIADLVRLDQGALSIPEDSRFVAPSEPIWERLLLAMVCVMLLETCVALWITQRRARRSGPVELKT